MTDNDQDGKQVDGRAEAVRTWAWREQSKLEGLQVYAVSQEVPHYSPDRTWLIIGTGATGRLTDYLNSLEAELASLRAKAALADSQAKWLQSRQLGDEMPTNLRAFEMGWLSRYEKLKESSGGS